MNRRRAERLARKELYRDDPQGRNRAVLALQEFLTAHDEGTNDGAEMISRGLFRWWLAKKALDSERDKRG